MPEPPCSSAPPTPSSLTSTVRQPSRALAATVAVSAPACLAMLARHSETTKYAAASTASGRGSFGVASTSTGTVPREVAQLLEREVRLLARLAHELDRGGIAVLGALLGHAQVQRERDEPLLGA